MQLPIEMDNMWISGTWTKLGQQRMEDQNESAMHTGTTSESEAQAFLAGASATAASPRRPWRPVQPGWGRNWTAKRRRAAGRPGEPPVLELREERRRTVPSCRQTIGSSGTRRNKSTANFCTVTEHWCVSRGHTIPDIPRGIRVVASNDPEQQ